MSRRPRPTKLVSLLAFALSLMACSPPPPAVNTASKPRAAYTGREPEIRSGNDQGRAVLPPDGQAETIRLAGSHMSRDRPLTNTLRANRRSLRPRGIGSTFCRSGGFTREQEKVIDMTAGYLDAFYDLPVEKMPARCFLPSIRILGITT